MVVILFVLLKQLENFLCSFCGLDEYHRQGHFKDTNLVYQNLDEVDLPIIEWNDDNQADIAEEMLRVVCLE